VEFGHNVVNDVVYVISDSQDVSDRSLTISWKTKLVLTVVMPAAAAAAAVVVVKLITMTTNLCQRCCYCLARGVQERLSL